LKGFISTTILLKNDNSTLMSPIATLLAKAQDPNTPSLTSVDVIDVEFDVKA
jgi:hypothetical protein